MRGMRAGAAVVAAGIAWGSARADAPAPGGFTPEQRAAIVAIVRDAMKRDPSILRDAVTSLRAAEAKSEAATQASAVEDHRAELLTGDAVVGNSAGDVTLTEFYDPRCPYCKRMIPILNATIAHDRSLRVVYRVIPVLGAASIVEAKAILAAGRQDRYVAMQEALMASGAPPTDANIAETARKIGIDPKRLAVDMADPALAAQLKANMSLAAALGADGTPTFVIGRAVLPGMVEADDLKQAIADARS